MEVCILAGEALCGSEFGVFVQSSADGNELLFSSGPLDGCIPTYLNQVTGHEYGLGMWESCRHVAHPSE